jgi:hypothetical protein
MPSGSTGALAGIATMEVARVRSVSSGRTTFAGREGGSGGWVTEVTESFRGLSLLGDRFGLASSDGERDAPEAEITGRGSAAVAAEPGAAGALLGFVAFFDSDAKGTADVASIIGPGVSACATGSRGRGAPAGATGSIGTGGTSEEATTGSSNGSFVSGSRSDSVAGVDSVISSSGGVLGLLAFATTTGGKGEIFFSASEFLWRRPSPGRVIRRRVLGSPSTLSTVVGAETVSVKASSVGVSASGSFFGLESDLAVKASFIAAAKDPAAF